MKITIIGSGNVGSALAISLRSAGHTICEICGTNKKTVAQLAKKVRAKALSAVKNLSDSSDLYIICVNDQSILKVVEKFPFNYKPVVHTSGATKSTVLKRFSHHGVLYPVNSISNSFISFQSTPFCITASNSQCSKLIKLLVKDLNAQSYLITDKQRLAVHLAAVFANNFSNALYQSAYEILLHEQIPFNILHRLIEETTLKIKDIQPSKAQTGPAFRGDVDTMRSHLQLLKNQPELKKVYQLLSALISGQHNLPL